MNDFSQTMQRIVNLSDSEKVSLAASAYQELMPIFRRVDEQHNGIHLLFTVLGTAVGADGKLNSRESALVRALLTAEGLRLDDDDVLKITKTATGGKAGYALVKKLAGVMNAQDTANLVTLISAICAIDDTISREEVAYIVGLLN